MRAFLGVWSFVRRLCIFTFAFFIYQAEAVVYGPSPSNASLSTNGKMIVEALKLAAGLEPDVINENKLIIDNQKTIERRDASPSASNSINFDDGFFDDSPMEDTTDFDSFKANTQKQFESNKSQWQKDFDAIQAYWDQQREIFIKDLPGYQSGIVPYSVLKRTIFDPPPSDLTPKKPKKTDPGQFHVLPRAFSVPIQNQASRPTCNAFASIRGMESLLAQNNAYRDLSEQYYYWLAKPKCQSSPCSSAGSSIFAGVYYSQKTQAPTIPLESHCPYNKKPIDKNETQIPLSSGCTQGVAKVKGFQEVRTSQIVASLEANRPVVAGTRLTPNYYKTKGFVSLADAKKSGSLDRHAGGHAMLFVGYIMLPERLRSTEGAYCLITANSWGDGWGRGGYSCLSQAWVENLKIHFFSINSVEIRL